LFECAFRRKFSAEEILGGISFSVRKGYFGGFRSSIEQSKESRAGTKSLETVSHYFTRSEAGVQDKHWI